MSECRKVQVRGTDARCEQADVARLLPVQISTLLSHVARPPDPSVCRFQSQLVVAPRVRHRVCARERSGPTQVCRLPGLEEPAKKVVQLQGERRHGRPMVCASSDHTCTWRRQQTFSRDCPRVPAACLSSACPVACGAMNIPSSACLSRPRAVAPGFPWGANTAIGDEHRGLAQP